MFGIRSYEDRDRIEDDLFSLRTSALNLLDPESYIGTISRFPIVREYPYGTVAPARTACAMKNNKGNLTLRSMYSNLQIFKDRTLEELKRAKRYPSFVSLLVVNLSHISSSDQIENHRTVNDFYGSIDSLVRKTVRETDLVGNVQRGKFAILLLETSLEGASVLSRRLEKTIKYFLCNNTKSPTSWRVPIKESCFPDAQGDGGSILEALRELGSH